MMTPMFGFKSKFIAYAAVLACAMVLSVGAYARGGGFHGGGGGGFRGGGGGFHGGGGKLSRWRRLRLPRRRFSAAVVSMVAACVWAAFVAAACISCEHASVVAAPLPRDLILPAVGRSFAGRSFTNRSFATSAGLPWRPFVLPTRSCGPRNPSRFSGRNARAAAVGAGAGVGAGALAARNRNITRNANAVQRSLNARGVNRAFNNRAALRDPRTRALITAGVAAAG